MQEIQMNDLCEENLKKLYDYIIFFIWIQKKDSDIITLKYK